MLLLARCIRSSSIIRNKPWPAVRQLLLSRTLLVLAIETSCDDTAVALLQVRSSLNGDSRHEHTVPHAKLLFNKKTTSDNVAYRGIHPLVALDSHRKNLSTLIDEAIQALPPYTVLQSSQYSHHELSLKFSGDHNVRSALKPDLIAVTRGPGMRSSLMAGLDTAKGLAVAWQIPLYGIHHMQAHALTPRLVAALSESTQCEAGVRPAWPDLKPSFPFLSLLVSGGHTLLLHSTGVAHHRILATTTDIAIGDSLDKIARCILPPHLFEASGDVAYGRLLESFAFPSPHYNYGPSRADYPSVDTHSVPYGWRLPTPLLQTRGGQKSKSMEFSFTGLSTHAIRIAENGWVDGKLGKVPRQSPMPEEEARFLAREVMRLAFEHLASRIVLHLENELHDISPTAQHSTTLVVSGGVAANQFMRHVLHNYLAVKGFGHVKIISPPMDLCTDNAAMIAWTAFEMFDEKKYSMLAGKKDYLEMDVLRKWSLENILSPEKEGSLQDSIGDAAAPDTIPKKNKASRHYELRLNSSHDVAQFLNKIRNGYDPKIEGMSRDSNNYTAACTSKIYSPLRDLKSSLRARSESKVSTVNPRKSELRRGGNETVREVLSRRNSTLDVLSLGSGRYTSMSSPETGTLARSPYRKLELRPAPRSRATSEAVARHDFLGANPGIVRDQQDINSIFESDDFFSLSASGIDIERHSSSTASLKLCEEPVWSGPSRQDSQKSKEVALKESWEMKGDVIKPAAGSDDSATIPDISLRRLSVTNVPVTQEKAFAHKEEAIKKWKERIKWRQSKDVETIDQAEKDIKQGFSMYLHTSFDAPSKTVQTGVPSADQDADVKSPIRYLQSQISPEMYEKAKRARVEAVESGIRPIVGKLYGGNGCIGEGESDLAPTTENGDRPFPLTNAEREKLYELRHQGIRTEEERARLRLLSKTNHREREKLRPGVLDKEGVQEKGRSAMREEGDCLVILTETETKELLGYRQQLRDKTFQWTEERKKRFRDLSRAQQREEGWKFNDGVLSITSEEREKVEELSKREKDGSMVLTADDYEKVRLLRRLQAFERSQDSFSDSRIRVMKERTKGRGEVRQRHRAKLEKSEDDGWAISAMLP